MDLIGQTFYSMNMKENMRAHIRSCICTAPCFLGNKRLLISVPKETDTSVSASYKC